MICAISAVAVLFIGIIRVDVPPEFRGTLVAQGRITHCDFERIRGGQFFMGVTLDTPGVPYLRFNAASSERGTYEAMCARRPKVHVTYHAIKRLLGSTSFWIQQIVET